MLVSNLIEYNHFCQIGFSSVNTVIICFISEVSLRFPFQRFFSRSALDIHPVSSLWVLLHMIPWFLSSVTCKLPLVLVIIFLRRDISCLMILSFKACFLFIFNVEYVMTVFHSWPLMNSSWTLCSSTSSFSSMSFHHDYLSHLSTSSFSSWQYIRCQHSLTVDHWWCFHVNLFWTPFCGSRIPGVVFFCMTHTSSRHLFIGVGLKWSSCTLVNIFTRF